MSKRESERSNADLTLRPMSKTGEDLALFAACFAKNSAPRKRAALEWQYIQNPTGTLFVDFALSPDGRAAAIYATLPVRMRVQGEVVLGMQSVDTITDEEFRGRGLFLKLATTTYDRASQAGARLVYGFPNGKSAHGFFERLSWANLDPVPFLIRPLRSGYVLRQLRAPQIAKLVPEVTLFRTRRRPPRRGRLERVHRFDERATALWHEFAEGIEVAVERDAAYLNWRVFDKPEENYVVHGIFEGDRLRALVCHVVKAKHGGNVGYIMESLCSPGWERDLRYLLSNALAAMTADGADAALAWCLPHTRTFFAFLRQGFIPFPTKLRPIELHFGARPLDAPGPSLVTQRRNWYLSYLDADTT